MKTEKSKAKGRPSRKAPETALDTGLPTVTAPAMARDWADLAGAKDLSEKMTSVAGGASDAVAGTIAAATRSNAEYGTKVLDMVCANTNSFFDLAQALMAARSLADVVELSTAHGRKQFDALSAQSKELTELTQKLALESAETMRAATVKVFGRRP